MKFDVKIDCMALFNECMDQTLIDYRNRTTETGQSIAAPAPRPCGCCPRSA